MIPKSLGRHKRCRFLQIFLTIFLFTAGVWAEPSDSPVQRVVRNSQSGSSLQALVSKNYYRQEAYQAQYTVEVPYQTTEEYVVDIPYETTETYMDYEQQCHWENRCHDRPREECSYEPICRQVPDNVCRQERVCRPVPGEQRCEEVTECGTNAQGQPICKTRKVCHGGESREDCGMVERCENRSRQECSQERRCRTVMDRQCGNENVCQSVPVTRTRTVTKYRQETRTRTVTKTRSETRCCRTEYRQVFDHQDQLNVSLEFPQAAVLAGLETETFEVELKGQAPRLDLEVRVLDSVFGYRVARKQISGARADIELALVPKHSAQELGPGTIQDPKLNLLAQGVQVKFKDLGQRPRVQTQYEVLVKSMNETVVARGLAAGNGREEINLPLSATLEIGQSYILEIKVHREGAVLADPIDFAHRVSAQIEGISDLGPYQDPSRVMDPRLIGLGSSASLILKDLSPKHPAVKTRYDLKIQRQSGIFGQGRKDLIVVSLNREDLTVNASGEMEIPLASLGVGSGDLERYIQSNWKVRIELTAVRQSTLFVGNSEVRVSKEVEIRLP